jgi:hypothetical protein
MSIGSLFKKLAASPTGKALLAWGRTEAEQAIAALKNSATGAQIVKLVHDAEATGKSGPEKLATVLLDAGPLVVGVLQVVGVLKSPVDVETLTRAVVESIVADLKAGDLAKAVLKGLGV